MMQSDSSKLPAFSPSPPEQVGLRHAFNLQILSVQYCTPITSETPYVEITAAVDSSGHAIPVVLVTTDAGLGSRASQFEGTTRRVDLTWHFGTSRGQATAPRKVLDWIEERGTWEPR